MTAHLVLTVTSFTYHSVSNPTNPEFLDSNYPGVHRVVHNSENLSIKYHEQKFCIKSEVSGQHWTGMPIEKCKKYQFQYWKS